MFSLFFILCSGLHLCVDASYNCCLFQPLTYAQGFSTELLEVVLNAVFKKRINFFVFLHEGMILQNLIRKFFDF